MGGHARELQGEMEGQAQSTAQLHVSPSEGGREGLGDRSRLQIWLGLKAEHLALGPLVDRARNSSELSPGPSAQSPHGADLTGAPVPRARLQGSSAQPQSYPYTPWGCSAGFPTAPG